MAVYVVNLGPSVLTNYLIAAGVAPIYVGWGTGSGTTAKTDTSLFGEKALDLSSSSGSRTAGVGSRATVTNTNDEWIVVATLMCTADGTVTNAGLFDNATIGLGTMFAKGDHTPQSLFAGDGIEYHFHVPIGV